MKKLMIIIGCLVQLIVHAQLKKEIDFTVKKNWNDILKTAKAENKVIFVCVYATWCGPCKMMDSNVYTDPLVADFCKENYISIKVQIDQTKNDSRYIKDLYKDAEELRGKYNITSVPTFLFISHKNELIYREEGYYNPDQFLSILKNAKNSETGFESLIKQYKNGKLSDEEILSLSLKAKRYHQDSLALEIARQYKTTVADKTNPSIVLTVQLVEYLIAFKELFSIKDPLIKYLLMYPVKSDLLMKQIGLSGKMKEYYLVKDFINPIMKPNNRYTIKPPDWNALEKKIRQQSNRQIAKRLIINAKIYWYNDKKDWGNVVKYNIEKIDFLGIDTIGFGSAAVNNMVFNVIFPYSNDYYSLNKGIEYMEFLLKINPDQDVWIDTYANLLYKIGKKSEAIKHEEYALNIANNRNDSGRITEYQENLFKMLNNLPTWGVPTGDGN